MKQCDQKMEAGPASSEVFLYLAQLDSEFQISEEKYNCVV